LWLLISQKIVPVGPYAGSQPMRDYTFPRIAGEYIEEEKKVKL
jgi:hypothetical protein